MSRRCAVPDWAKPSFKQSRRGIDSPSRDSPLPNSGNERLTLV